PAGAGRAARGRDPHRGRRAGHGRRTRGAQRRRAEADRGDRAAGRPELIFRAWSGGHVVKDILLFAGQRWLVGLAGLALVVASCAEPPSPPAPAPAPVEAAPVSAAAGPQIVAAPAEGEVAAIVREAVAAGTGPLVVSV